MEKAINLTECPVEVLVLDSNSASLWPVLLKKVGVTISKGEHIEDRRAWMLRNFGVDDLANRLSVQQKRENGGPQDDVARARIWRHVAEACLPGDSISDLTTNNAYLLNAFIVTKAKRFATPFDAYREATGSELPLCANNLCPNGPARVPSPRAKFCSKSCRNVVSRREGYVKPSRTAKIASQIAA
jgi:hypothetical protein